MGISRGALLILPLVAFGSAAAADKPAPAAAQTKPETKLDTKVFATPPPLRGEDEYVIGAFDKLQIGVFDLKELDTERRVSADGKIALPLLGEVAVGGLTPRQAEQEIAQQLRDRKFVNDPQVSVTITEYVSRRVFVQGAVHLPKAVELLGSKTLLDVIGEVGGPSDRAGKKIFIFRPFGSGPDRIEIDADKLLYEGDPLLNVPMQPGDIVSIPFEQELVIYVNGEVRTPGAIKFDRDERVTVLRAVTAAGGAGERANEGRVRVIRQAPDGTQQVFKVNLSRIKKGKDDDFVLQRNDIVVVPTSFF